MSDLLREKIDNAAARRAADAAKLRREDGSRRYTEAEHQERVQAINGRFHEEVDTLRQSIQAEISAAEARCQQIIGSDPLDDLSPDDLSAAGARAAFVREEVEGLDAERLRIRLGAILAASDTPTKAVYFHYLKRRVAEEPAVGIALHDELSALEEKLGRGEAIREAQARLESLREVDQHAALKRRGFSSPLQKHMDEQYGTLADVARR